MGMAWLCNLAFNTIDVLMLGVMSSPQQVGLYGAAYRVLNQLLVTYYLLTQVLYPRFVCQRIEDRGSMLRPSILLPLAGAGILIAAVLSVSRQWVLTVEFGHQFLAASPLLLLLAWSIPLDFLTSYLSNAYIAWGMEKNILLCTAIGAASNIALNLAFIPRYGARSSDQHAPVVRHLPRRSGLCRKNGARTVCSKHAPVERRRLPVSACPTAAGEMTQEYRGVCRRAIALLSSPSAAMRTSHEDYP
jgi:hypothetical protein